jgi:hypothetical protein
LIEIPLVLDHAAFEAALEEMALAVVAAVEADRVQAIQPLHPRGQLRLVRVDEEVEVVVEQVPAHDPPAVTARDLDEELEPRFAIAIVLHDRSLLDAPADHVVPGGARQLRPRDPGHAPTLPRCQLRRNRR